MTHSLRPLARGTLLVVATLMALPLSAQTLTLGDGATLRLDAESTLDLGTGTTLAETDGARLTGGTGIVRATRDLTAPKAVDVGGLGATLSSPAALGLTAVTRGHVPQTADGAPGIARYYDVVPTNNAALDAALVFAYREAELNGLAEADLALYRSDDGGTSFTLVPSTVDPVANTLTATGLESVARFTAATGPAPPVIVLTMTPQTSPVEVPAGGGSFAYTVTLANTTASNQPFRGIIDVVLPNGATFGPVLSRTAAVPGGGVIGPITLQQQVPAAAPAGSYVYRATLENPSSGAVIDQTTFPVTKLPPSTRLQASAEPQASAGLQASNRSQAGKAARSSGRTAPPSSARAAGDAAPTLSMRTEEWSVLGTAVLFGPEEPATDEALAATDEVLDATAEAAKAGSRALPTDYALAPPRPNPTTHAATVAYDLPEPSDVDLTVYDVLGRRVATLAQGTQEAGRYAVQWRTSSASSGVYIVRFVAEGVTRRAHATRRLIVVR